MSNIQWTERTWNPIVGCSKVSEGCRNCYALTMADRLKHMRVPHYEGITKRDRRGQVQWTGKVAMAPQHILMKPLKRRKPTMYFVNSMSDLFHEHLSNRDIAAIFGIMAACPQHTFQVLTKRPERASDWFEWLGKHAYHARHTMFPHDTLAWCARQRVGVAALEATGHPPVNDGAWPLKNAWIGTSVESQDVMDRVDHLTQVPAAIRFLSCEPLLSPLDLRDHLHLVDWVIVGGESGPGARPVGLGWIRSIVDQCKAAGVACFVKQMGTASGWSRKEHKDPAYWPAGLRVREYPLTNKTQQQQEVTS